jgi:anti-anti-sigma factor
MEIASTQHNKVTVVSVMDNLDATTAAEARAHLGDEIEAGHTNLIIDMSGVTYLSSAGLRVILATMQQARSAGGDVRLAGAVGKIQQVIDMAGFPKIIKTFPTVEEAITSYVS